jgi:hypothetical protein
MNIEYTYLFSYKLLLSFSAIFGLTTLESLYIILFWFIIGLIITFGSLGIHFLNLLHSPCLVFDPMKCLIKCLNNVIYRLDPQAYLVFLIIRKTLIAYEKH